VPYRSTSGQVSAHVAYGRGDNRDRCDHHNVRDTVMGFIYLSFYLDGPRKLCVAFDFLFLPISANFLSIIRSGLVRDDRRIRGNDNYYIIVTVYNYLPIYNIREGFMFKSLRGAKLLCNTRGRFITVGLGNHRRGKDKMTGKYGYYADDDDDDAILNYKPFKPPGVTITTAVLPDPCIFFLLRKKVK